MSKQSVKNMGASVRARLMAMSRERNQTFQLVLTNYVLERLLYRLSQTEHRTRFILKGAMLLTKWFDDPLRPTQDVIRRGVLTFDRRPSRTPVYVQQRIVSTI